MADNPGADPMALPIKLLVLGDQAVGKTALIRKLVRDEFTPKYKPTAGVDFALKELEVEGSIARLQVWDVRSRRGIFEPRRESSRIIFLDAR